MVRILYIVSTLRRSGPINVLFNLIAELDQQKFTPIILTLSPEDSNYPSTKQLFIEKGVEIHSLELSRLKGFFAGRAKLKTFIKEHNINVIHLMGLRGDLLIKPSDFSDHVIISTIHSNIYDDYTMLYGKIKGRIMARQHINSLSGKIGIACSKFVSDKLHDRYGIDLKVIYNGIPKNQYAKASEDERLGVLKELNLNHNKRNFIFVGSLIYRKNPISVITSFFNNKDIEDIHLIIIGDGPLRAECERLCKNDMDKVSFFGNQPETLKFLKASDYYIASSYSEGLPTSVMEAMGCGLPVILSDIAPHEELVAPLNEWPYLFPADDVNILSGKIKEILKDDHSVLSRRCRGIIDERFNSELMALNYQLLYQKGKL